MGFYLVRKAGTTPPGCGLSWLKLLGGTWPLPVTWGPSRLVCLPCPAESGRHF